MSAPVLLVQSDTGPVIPLYVTNNVTGAVVDLTTMVSARMLFRAINTTTPITTLTLTVLGAATLGTLSLTPTSAMTATAGEFEGEIEITMPGPMIVSGYTPVRFSIRAQFL